MTALSVLIHLDITVPVSPLRSVEIPPVNKEQFQSISMLEIIWELEAMHTNKTKQSGLSKVNRLVG